MITRFSCVYAGMNLVCFTVANRNTMKTYHQLVRAQKNDFEDQAWGDLCLLLLTLARNSASHRQFEDVPPTAGT